MKKVKKMAVGGPMGSAMTSALAKGINKMNAPKAPAAKPPANSGAGIGQFSTTGTVPESPITKPPANSGAGIGQFSTGAKPAAKSTGPFIQPFFGKPSGPITTDKPIRQVGGPAAKPAVKGGFDSIGAIGLRGLLDKTAGIGPMIAKGLEFGGTPQTNMSDLAKGYLDAINTPKAKGDFSEKKVAGNTGAKPYGSLVPAVPRAGNMKKGGKVSSASSRGDGCAIKGKTKGRMV